jgi:hypothetical protein
MPHKVTFYKGKSRFIKWYKSYKKAMNSKMAMRKKNWKSSRITQQY